MKLEVTDEFRALCKDIFEEYEAIGDKALVWSDDRYQSDHFCGGWDPHHARYFFSYYAPDGGDYIFSFTLDDARLVHAGGTIDPVLDYWKKSSGW